MTFKKIGQACRLCLLLLKELPHPVPSSRIFFDGLGRASMPRTEPVPIRLSLFRFFLKGCRVFYVLWVCSTFIYVCTHNRQQFRSWRKLVCNCDIISGYVVFVQLARASGGKWILLEMLKYHVKVNTNRSISSRMKQIMNNIYPQLQEKR